jgi:hypothetical protein
MKEKNKFQKGFSRIGLIFIGLIILGFSAIWLSYGTLHPCGVLKKEVRNMMEEEVKAGDDLSKGLFVLFGDSIINHVIVGLSPLECMSRIITINFKSKAEINKMIEGDLYWLFSQ